MVLSFQFLSHLLMTVTLENLLFQNCQCLITWKFRRSASSCLYNVTFLLSTVGGSQNLRTYWSHYLKNAHIMVFVVDSTDDKRLQLARQELHRLLEEATQLPLMVLANKQVNIGCINLCCIDEHRAELICIRVKAGK